MRAAFPAVDVNTARCVPPEGFTTSRDKMCMFCQKQKMTRHPRPTVYSVKRELRMMLVAVALRYSRWHDSTAQHGNLAKH